MRALRVAIAASLIAALQIVAAPPVSAQGGGCLHDCGAGGDAGSDSGSISTAVTFESGGSSPVPAGNPPAWLAACSWTLLNPGDEVPAEFGETGVFAEELTESTWVVTCPTSSIFEVGFGDTATGILEIFPDGDVPDRLVDALIQEASDQVPLVAFYPTAAPEGTEAIPMIARFPTVLWVPDAEWQPVSATASIPPLSVTATAFPVATVWSGGDDPTEVECEQGVPVRRDIAFEDNDFSCSIMFHHTNNVQSNELTLVVTWDVFYECSAVCGSGQLDSQVITSTRPVRVGEIQALVTDFGG